MTSKANEPGERCGLLRSLHRAGDPLVLPNACDVATARDFTARARGPVNVLKTPRSPSLPELAELGVARISFGSLLHRDAMENFGGLLRTLL
jgi:2-methylisocitrate lyase-like PEP mutase family enzyme